VDKYVVGNIESVARELDCMVATFHCLQRGHVRLLPRFRRGLADGGVQKLLERLKRSTVRARIKKNSRAIIRTGKTSFTDCGGPAGVLIAFRRKS